MSAGIALGIKSITSNSATADAVLNVYDATLVVGGPISEGAAVIAVVDASVVGTKLYDASVVNGVSVVLTGGQR